MRFRACPIYWAIPLLVYSTDAAAWGLYTHVYFAQLLLVFTPAMDPRFLRALRGFPHLVLAGACLPDLSLTGTHAGTAAFRHSHQWSVARRVLDSARDETDRALALGYASHLLVDVIAHNHFVPAHEHMWFKRTMATHAISEWAMDEHVGRQLFLRPAALLRAHARDLLRFATQHFGCSRTQAAKALDLLQGAERLLRASRLPRMLYGSAGALDSGLAARFDFYIAQTAMRMRQINRVLLGEEPLWGAEVACRETARSRLQGCARHELAHRLRLPQDLF